jgi:hypothetical protein
VLERKERHEDEKSGRLGNPYILTGCLILQVIMLTDIVDAQGEIGRDMADRLGQISPVTQTEMKSVVDAVERATYLDGKDTAKAVATMHGMISLRQEDITAIEQEYLPRVERLGRMKIGHLVSAILLLIIIVSFIIAAPKKVTV